MPRYQLRRPSPVTIIPKQRVRRQQGAPAGEVVEVIEEVEEVEGPESPDSPESSPSVSGASSSEDDSDSEDEGNEPPSPQESKASVPSISAPAQEAPTASLPSAAATQPPAPSSAPSLAASPPAAPPAPAPAPSSVSQPPPPPPVSSPVGASTSPAAAPPPSFVRPSSTPGNNANVPQVTATSSVPTASPAQTSAGPSSVASVSPATTGDPPSSTATQTDRQPSNAVVSQSQPPAPASSSPVPTGDSPLPAGPQQETGNTQGPPQEVNKEEPTMITRGAVAAAISLSITGAIVLLVAAFILFKRRKRRQNLYGQRVADDAFNPNNTGSLHAPETAHVASDLPFFAGGGSHVTRSTERSDTLFAAGPYERPETVSTNRNKSRFPVKPGGEQPMPTPNPFADPPLNKAYDVLAGRPRSTTLTDRGSWLKNPFRDPASERFDPFGELREKAYRERRRQMEEARKEAEYERAKQLEKKEAMGLAPEGYRKGSDATVEGLGVLDRGGAGMYR